jgi:copper chaperone
MNALCSGLFFQQETAMNHLFTVEGMTCGHCDKAVTRALLTVDPQAQVIIDRDHHHVTVKSNHPRETLRQAIVQEGYAVLT